jgi:hypothetical protein
LKRVSHSYSHLDPPVKTRDHVIHHFFVADETAAIQLSLWDEFGDSIEVGDILSLKNGKCALWTNSLELQKGKKGTLVKIGEFTMVFNESKNMSQYEWIEEPFGSKKYSIKGMKQPQVIQGGPIQKKVEQTPRKKAF